MKHSACEHCSTPVEGALRLPRRFGRALIWLYRHTLSPLVGYNCRHLPTCSMTLARLLRCNPWGTSGIDNVPPAVPQNARWYLPWRYARWRGVNPS
jgi:putative component of membrane protein insertase Oxa1/YidC/SpoIIIJ protein YidD